MDTSKLLNVVADLDNEESNTSTVSILEDLAANINSGQTSAIIESEKGIQEIFEKSIVNKYVPSNIEILNTIGGANYFGNSAYQEIRAILNKNTYNIQQTYLDLTKYINQRSQFVGTIKALRANLISINIEAHFPTEDNYQVGLLLPDNYTKCKIVNITRELIKWDKLMKSFKEIIGEPSEDTEINYVSNGTLEFFINNSPGIAAILAFTIDRITKVYKNIIEIRQARERLKELGLPSTESKTLEKQEKEHLIKELDKIAADLIKDFVSKKIETGRLNELKIAVKGHVVYLAKCIDNGIIIEINPPEIDEPREPSEDDSVETKSDLKKEKVDYDKKIKQIEIIQQSMETIKTIGKFGIDLGKFLTDGSQPDESDSK
jgi:hypothetical protein